MRKNLNHKMYKLRDFQMKMIIFPLYSHDTLKKNYALSEMKYMKK